MFAAVFPFFLLLLVALAPLVAVVTFVLCLCVYVWLKFRNMTMKLLDVSPEGMTQ